MRRGVLIALCLAAMVRVASGQRGTNTAPSPDAPPQFTNVASAAGVGFPPRQRRHARAPSARNHGQRRTVLRLRRGRMGGPVPGGRRVARRCQGGRDGARSPVQEPRQRNVPGCLGILRHRARRVRHGRLRRRLRQRWLDRSVRHERGTEPAVSQRRRQAIQRRDARAGVAGSTCLQHELRVRRHRS